MYISLNVSVFAVIPERRHDKIKCSIIWLHQTAENQIERNLGLDGPKFGQARSRRDEVWEI